MRRYDSPAGSITQAHLAALASTQADINSAAAGDARRRRAVEHWANRTQNRTFDALRDELRRMAGELERCFYCEDSCADQIEHVWPKKRFPERTFVWENYCFACGTCNRPKTNHFQLIDPHSQAVIKPERWPNSEPWPPGWDAALLIDPRREDPRDLLWLDLSDTFRFEPARSLHRIDMLRAYYTIELLTLNRPVLERARRAARARFTRLLGDFVARAELPCDRVSRSQRFQRECRDELHYTVWLEMKRQHERLGGELAQLFARAPEALGW
jgi:uncharacterized protein (TIGR02646 family)